MSKEKPAVTEETEKVKRCFVGRGVQFGLSDSFLFYIRIIVQCIIQFRP
jgi:hypothetical protein